MGCGVPGAERRQARGGVVLECSISSGVFRRDRCQAGVGKGKGKDWGLECRG